MSSPRQDDLLIRPTETDEDSAPAAVEQIVAQAERAGASDVHIQMRNSVAELAFRLDGVMTPAHTIRSGLAERVCGRIKYLARLKTYQESLPQDGRIDKSALKLNSDVRVATYPTVTGEKIVLRLFKETQAHRLDDLGLPGEARAAIELFLTHHSGMMLLTGPAGSGKTTTIYACLDHLARQGGKHIITVEDPVEQVLNGIMQTEINEERGLGFACAARHLLRQDPQVLVIGEIRDEATAQIALRAALTGHTVISTLHAGSCRGVFERLASFLPDFPTMANGIHLVMNQRLIRSVCPDCLGKRCARCLSTGFRGRLPLVEFLEVSDAVRELILARRFKDIVPGVSLDEAGRDWVARGLTSEAEIRRVL